MNGKAFRYVHRYLGGQVFGCGGGGGAVGLAGAENTAHTCLTHG